MLIHTRHGDIVAAGQKSGIFWGLRADNGSVAWSTIAGPGSSLGGMEWGSATDGERIYFAIANFNFIPHAMTNPPPARPATSVAGSWGAIDPATGDILWQTADPNAAIDTGPVSVANGVVYVGSMAGFPGVDARQAHDVRPRRPHRQAALELRQWRLGQRRAGDRGRPALLGLGVLKLRPRRPERQAVLLLALTGLRGDRTCIGARSDGANLSEPAVLAGRARAPIGADAGRVYRFT